MIVIAHKAIGMAVPVITFIYLLKGIKEGFSIVIVFINGLPLISPAGDMVDSSGIFYAKRPGHK
jgi:hypothetical protein